MFIYLLFTLFLVGQVLAGHRLLENTLALPTGWKLLDKTPDPNQEVKLSFALHQPKIGLVRDKIGSGLNDSGGYLSHNESQTLRNPSQTDVTNVLNWLKDSNISESTYLNSDWIHIKITVKRAESLLDMVLNYYQFEEQKPILRTRKYAVPEAVFDAIDFVHPIANFMRPKKELTSATPDVTPKILASVDIGGLNHSLRKRRAVCSDIATPECLRAQYNVDYSTPDNSSSIRLGIAGFLDQYANYKDSNMFLQGMAPDLYAAGYNYSIVDVNSARNSQNRSMAGIEAALDVQYSMGIGHPVDITYYLVGGRGTQLNDSGGALSAEESSNEPYLEFLEYLLDKPDCELPHVISISYADNEVSVPALYAHRVYSMFGLLTARGTSILAASGDGGTRGSGDSNCRTNDGSNRDVAMAVFPATCPWVTAVGAVTGASDPPEGASFSGGGFSQMFARPQWQNSAVSGYVKALNGRMMGYYNDSFRAVPDISAQGTSFMIMQNGYPMSVQGTSASTPIVAAMIALINDARVRRGKNVLGFLNRILYTEQVQSTLLDITKGQSYECTFSGNESEGWTTAEGWDAVTGLGVPNDFKKLIDLLVSI
ncbi:hypothetical protein G7Z17_g1492 [Cylindrodendrum hubeiense]|uniref:tripeptidyl-peptidase II n=1 Tax=Cylindrodendrum hubeiense TaxID=595255 RepID=A0A9P5LM15_9HYPO|nr:hypothetical protein G7Z17_g1492 [Cylindrodendrum hubeiense]